MLGLRVLCSASNHYVNDWSWPLLKLTRKFVIPGTSYPSEALKGTLVDCLL